MSFAGRLLRATVLGASHGPGVGVLLEGCPAGLPLSADDLLPDLQRRRGGRPGTTDRVEDDLPTLAAGVHEGRTTGQPLLVWFENTRQGPPDPVDRRHVPRPGHADLPAVHRYGGFHDPRGGGPFSGRLTVGVVAAGAIARRLLPADVRIEAHLLRVGGRTDIDAAVDEARAAGDSLGGVLECRCTGLPPGLGEPPHDPLDARLARECLCIPGIRGFEIGDGFVLAALPGSQANDTPLEVTGRAATHRAGGVQAGMTNGNDLVFRVAARPAPSLPWEQPSIDLRTGAPARSIATGAQDACYALRLPVVVEAVAALVLADFLLLRRALAPQAP